MAICFLIIDWSYKNDLFYYNIFDTPVEILKSHRVGLKHGEFEQEPNNHMPIRTFLKTFSIAQDYARYHSLFDIGHGHSLSPVAILLYLPNHKRRRIHHLGKKRYCLSFN